MLLLFIYISVALGFSFLCSIAEAVLLSVTVGYIAMKEKENKPYVSKLRTLKEDINKPLAAILTLNTIAHTVGAAGAGAQATAVFGSAYFGIVSAILTVLILVFSEIIPKTLGAHYWQSLAPATTYGVVILVRLLYPFVKLSEYLTGSITQGPGLKGFNRDELSAMAELSWQEGLLEKRESKILLNLLSLHKVMVRDAMTPQSVVFGINASMTIRDYCEQHTSKRFSRIPVYTEEPENVNGFVLLSDLLLAHASGDDQHAVSQYQREIKAILDTMPLSNAFNQLIKQRDHILLVVDEYGKIQGLITLEDTLEAILGLDIIDEGDKSRDMQELARRFWQRRAKQKGLNLP